MTHSSLPPSSLPLARRAASMQPSAIREILQVTEAPDVISFAGGLPAPELFPVNAIARAAETVLRQDGPSALQYSTTEGFTPLREWICHHLADTVGLQPGPTDVIVTHGSQQGLDLLAKVLIDPGDVVLVENPAYLGALQAFGTFEARVVGVETDKDGLRPESLLEALSRVRPHPKFLYLIANFHNPTGMTLSRERRQAIARIAAEAGLLVIEDDPYGSLRYEGSAERAVGAQGDTIRWVYLGTSSKILAPGLRIAWLVTPERPLREKLITAKQATDLHTSSLGQRLVWQCIQEPGFLESHISRLRQVYGERRDLMLDALARHLQRACSWQRPAGGLFLWVTLPAGTDATALLRRAVEARIAFVPGESFWVGEPRRNTLRLNFSNATEAGIETGIERLGRLLAETT